MASGAPLSEEAEEDSPLPDFFFFFLPPLSTPRTFLCQSPMGPISFALCALDSQLMILAPFDDD